MKHFLLTVAFVSIVFSMLAQTVIKKPVTGMTNAGYLSISQIEINKNETVLTFYVEPWANNFGIAAKSYILVQGQPDTLFMTKQDAPSKGPNGYINVPPEGLFYKLYFPPINPNVVRIDFGEPVNSGWYIYDIEIGKQPNRSVVPKEFLGNWFSEDKKLWEYGFYDSVAVYGKKGWTYKSVENLNGLYKINLIGEGEEKPVYAKKGEEMVCWFGFTSDNLKKYSTQFPGTGVMDFSSYGEAKTNETDPGKVVYSGYINKFNPRVGVKSGMIQIIDNLTGTSEMQVVQINQYGLFTVEFPLLYPHEISIIFPGRRDRVFLEPGTKLFHFINSSSEPAYNLFMGKSAGLNYGLLTTRKLDFSQNEFLKHILNKSVQEYMAYVQDDEAKKLKELEDIRKINNLNDQTYGISKMNIIYTAAANALQCNTIMRLAVLYENQSRKDNEKLAYPDIKITPADLGFLKEIPVNNPDALLSSSYLSLINSLKNLNLNENNGSMYDVFTKLQSNLIEKGVALSLEENEMIQYIRNNMRGNYSQDVSTNFNQMYFDSYRNFQLKYKDEIQKISNDWMSQNFNYNTRLIFGISEGLPYEVLKTQDYFRSTKNAAPEDLAKAYSLVKGSLKTDVLKELVMSDYFRRKAESEVANSSDGLVYKNDADRFFDSLIKKYRGKVVFVDFWATWCAPCRMGIERIKPLKDELAKEDIVFVYITNPTSDEATYKKMKPDIKGEHYKVTSDEWNLLTSKFNIYGIPHYALADRKGKIVNPNVAQMENEPLKKLLLEEMKK